MPPFSSLRSRLAKTGQARLTVRARELASGWAAGSHRAERKGSGVEFAGHRAYTPGDDLRHLDRHALLRHKQLLVREFFTDTERSIHLVVDATASMHYRGQREDAKESRESKVERGLLLAAALAFVARQSGDLVGLTWVTDEREMTRKARVGHEAFEQVLHELVALDEAQLPDPPVASRRPVDWSAVFSRIGAAVPRGGIIFVLSDLLDLDPDASRSLAALCTRKRTVRAAQILTPEEVQFPFDGALRFIDPESGQEIETDGGHVRAEYRASLERLTKQVRDDLLSQGGSLHRVVLDGPAEDALRALAGGTTGARS